MSSSKATKYLKRVNPSGDFCCVPQCSMSGKFNSAVSFHHFPKNETLRKAWIRNLRRDDLTVKKATTVCSRHFVSSDVIQGDRRRLREGAVPLLFAWNDYSLAPPSYWERTKQPAGETEQKLDVKLVLQCHDYAARPEPAGSDPAREIVEAQRQELRRRLEEISLQQSFGLKRFLASDDDVRFFTRFTSYHHLLMFWRHIEPAAKRIVRADTHSSASSGATSASDKAVDHPRPPQTRSLPLIDELFLLLVYLSLGLEEKDLGDRFKVHQSTVGRIINTWVNFLYSLLGSVGIWMPADTIRATMPSVFGKYSDTQVIVDCVEMRCQTPSSVPSRSEMLSTMRGMVGVSPHGAVTFVSSLYSSSISDGELFRQSGIVLLLDKDMAVMVDKGFSIGELVPCKVYRPPAPSRNSQLSHNEVLLTQDAARLTIHVERAIRRFKESKIFHSIVPLTIAGSAEQLFAVACLLSNYQNKSLANARPEELT